MKIRSGTLVAEIYHLEGEIGPIIRIGVTVDQLLITGRWLVSFDPRESPVPEVGMLVPLHQLSNSERIAFELEETLSKHSSKILADLKQRIQDLQSLVKTIETRTTQN